MFYLGIDIGKNTHVASLMDDKANVIFKAFSFPNSSDGAASLINKIQPFSSQLEIGMEATGHYWLSLYSFLVEQVLLFMSLTLFRQMDGARGLKSESAKRTS